MKFYILKIKTNLTAIAMFLVIGHLSSLAFAISQKLADLKEEVESTLGPVVDRMHYEPLYSFMDQAIIPASEALSYLSDHAIVIGELDLRVDFDLYIVHSDEETLLSSSESTQVGSGYVKTYFFVTTGLIPKILFRNTFPSTRNLSQVRANQDILNALLLHEVMRTQDKIDPQGFHRNFPKQLSEHPIDRRADRDAAIAEWVLGRNPMDVYRMRKFLSNDATRTSFEETQLATVRNALSTISIKPLKKSTPFPEITKEALADLESFNDQPKAEELSVTKLSSVESILKKLETLVSSLNRESGARKERNLLLSVYLRNLYEVAGRTQLNPNQKARFHTLVLSIMLDDNVQSKPLSRYDRNDYSITTDLHSSLLPRDWLRKFSYSHSKEYLDWHRQHATEILAFYPYDDFDDAKMGLSKLSQFLSWPEIFDIYGDYFESLIKQKPFSQQRGLLSALVWHSEEIDQGFWSALGHYYVKTFLPNNLETPNSSSSLDIFFTPSNTSKDNLTPILPFSGSRMIDFDLMPAQVGIDSTRMLHALNFPYSAAYKKALLHYVWNNRAVFGLMDILFGWDGVAEGKKALLWKTIFKELGIRDAVGFGILRQSVKQFVKQGHRTKALSESVDFKLISPEHFENVLPLPDTFNEVLQWLNGSVLLRKKNSLAPKENGTPYWFNHKQLAFLVSPKPEAFPNASWDTAKENLELVHNLFAGKIIHFNPGLSREVRSSQLAAILLKSGINRLNAPFIEKQIPEIEFKIYGRYLDVWDGIGVSNGIYMDTFAAIEKICPQTECEKWKRGFLDMLFAKEGADIGIAKGRWVYLNDHKELLPKMLNKKYIHSISEFMDEMLHNNKTPFGYSQKGQVRFFNKYWKFVEQEWKETLKNRTFPEKISMLRRLLLPYGLELEEEKLRTSRLGLSSFLLSLATDANVYIRSTSDPDTELLRKAFELITLVSENSESDRLLLNIVENARLSQNTEILSWLKDMIKVDNLYSEEIALQLYRKATHEELIRLKKMQAHEDIYFSSALTDYLIELKSHFQFPSAFRDHFLEDLAFAFQLEGEELRARIEARKTQNFRALGQMIKETEFEYLAEVFKLASFKHRRELFNFLLTQQLTGKNTNEEIERIHFVYKKYSDQAIQRLGFEELFSFLNGDPLERIFVRFEQLSMEDRSKIYDLLFAIPNSYEDSLAPKDSDQLEEFVDQINALGANNLSWFYPLFPSLYFTLTEPERFKLLALYLAHLAINNHDQGVRFLSTIFSASRYRYQAFQMLKDSLPSKEFRPTAAAFDHVDKWQLMKELEINPSESNLIVLQPFWNGLLQIVYKIELENEHKGLLV